MDSPILLIALVALTLFTVGFGLAQRRPTSISLGVAFLLVVLFILAAIAQATDWRDADGWVDCWPRCSVVHEATVVGLYFVPLAAGFLIVVALVAWASGRNRRRGRHEGT